MVSPFLQQAEIVLAAIESRTSPSAWYLRSLFDLKDCQNW